MIRRRIGIGNHSQFNWGGSSYSIPISTFEYPRNADTFDINLVHPDKSITDLSLVNVQTAGSASVSIISGTTALTARITVGPFSSAGQTASVTFAITDGYFTTSTVTKTFFGSALVEL